MSFNLFARTDAVHRCFAHMQKDEPSSRFTIGEVLAKFSESGHISEDDLLVELETLVVAGLLVRTNEEPRGIGCEMPAEVRTWA